MTKQDIEKVLKFELETYCNNNNISCVWENTAYEPTIGTSYIEEYILWAESSDTVLASGHERHNGILQININVQANKGTALFWTIFNELSAIFETNSTIVNKYGRVRIEKSELSNSFIEGGWYTRYYSVSFSEFSDNTKT